MMLFLMRHGDAVHSAPSDAERVLSAAGRQEVLAAAGRLRESEPGIQRILSSPYARARQTAELVSEVLGVAPVESCDWVTPDNEPGETARRLGQLLAGCPSALVVTHQPIISRLIMYLTDTGVPMGTASIAWLNTLEAPMPVFEMGCSELICLI